MTRNRLAAISANLERRALMMDAVRSFFKNGGYLEVETPLRIPAPAPELHIDAQSSGAWFLQTSPELCMKQMLAGGYERIFQICKCFRQGERGSRHLPEMTMLEWYTAGQDYHHMMVQCEALINFIAAELGLGRHIHYQQHTIDITPPWPRLRVAEAFQRFGGCSPEAALAADRFDEIMGLQIEPRIGWERPTFLYDYPAACGALARLKPDQPAHAERFELYIGGLELCNAFSELTDPEEQRRRFASERDRRRAAGKIDYPLPEPFLDTLAFMPPATGNAMGIDRLAMLLTDADIIDQVVAFRPEDL